MKKYLDTLIETAACLFGVGVFLGSFFAGFALVLQAALSFVGVEIGISYVP